MILFEKFGQQQPLNRQSERYALEGVELSLSTLADQVGACAVALRPLHALIERHILAVDRLHGDDTTVPILASFSHNASSSRSRRIRFVSGPSQQPPRYRRRLSVTSRASECENLVSLGVVDVYYS